MATLSYATQFDTRIRDLYGHELVSNELFESNPDIEITNSKELKIPTLTVSEYKESV